MTTHTDLVRQALEAVTATFEGTIAELLRAGADGIYFATVDWASRDLMSSDDYRTWARPFDLRAFAAAASASFNVLHVCGSRNLLLDLADYPVHAFSWAATDPSNPSLAQALTKVRGAVMGGISQADSLLQRAPDQALAEYHAALEQTGGRRWMVAPGCSIPPTALEQNLRAVRDAVRATQLSGEPMR